MRKFLRLALVLSLVLAFAAPAFAQATRQHVLGGRALAPVGGATAARTATSTEGSADARAVVQRIVGVIGIPMTQFEVRASPDVANAEATTENGGKNRLILYNPAWMDGLRSSIATNWSDWLVLAHEVGHHVAFHMDPSFPNHEAELQADYFAGFILEKLGAPLSEVQLGMAMVSTDAETATHPSKVKRVAEVRKGWEAAARNVGANVIPAALTVPERSAIAPAPAASARPEQRVALLIGNTHYKTWGTPLKNPKNDVIAVGRQLRSLGFSTTVVYDGTSEQMSMAIAAFREEAVDSDWAVIYYAGTGIEVDGVNYMIPFEADDRRALEFTRDYPQMRLDTAFEAVKGAKRLRLVVADACRVDPAVTLGPPGAAKPQTFNVTEPPRGVLVAYSTAAGQYAQDGTGDLSPFAQAMIEALREPGIELPKVFRRAGAAVEAASQGTQLPTVIRNWPAEDLCVSQK
jgi:hypothetical protein